MNILITGGLGYLGGRIIDCLSKEIPSVKILIAGIEQHIPDWANEFICLKMDLADELSIEQVFAKNQIDIVVHLAALNEIDSLKNPLLAEKINTTGTYHLLEKASKYGVKKVIYFSTFHVYGDSNLADNIITENTPTRSFHPYATTHRAAEDWVNFFNRYHKMNTVILRLSNGYGYPMDKNVNRWTLVFNDLCRQAITHKKLILKSSGKQQRDFISLKDIARCVYHFIAKITDTWGDGLYNLGGECSMSILDVATLIARVYNEKYGQELEIFTGEDKGEYFSPVQYSIEKLKQTGFGLEGNMQKEISETFEVCEEFING